MAKTLLVVGDSLSAGYGLEAPQRSGWVALLGERLQGLNPEHRVVNASISGDTTAGGRARLAALLAEHKPDIVLLELGANDGLRGLPTKQMAENLQAMIEASRRSGAVVGLIGMEIPPNYGRRYTEQFRQVYRKLAKRHALVFYPFLLEGVSERPELMQEDRIHPNGEAQPLLLEGVWPMVESLLD